MKVYVISMNEVKQPNRVVGTVHYIAYKDRKVAEAIKSDAERNYGKLIENGTIKLGITEVLIE